MAGRSNSCESQTAIARQRLPQHRIGPPPTSIPPSLSRSQSCSGRRQADVFPPIGPVTQTPQKNSGPPTDAGATNFVRSTQAHSGLQCPELAQLRPQIVPWSTLRRADWVRNDLVLTMRGWLLGTTNWFSLRAARGHAVINGSGQADAIAGRPTHDHWTNSPQFRTHTTTIRCDCCTFAD